LGLEAAPEEYVSNLVDVFREVWRVLKKDGALWLNLGDCYATGAGKVGNCPGGGKQGEQWAGRDDHKGRGIPARVGGRTRGPRPDAWYERENQRKNVGPIQQPNRMPIRGLKPKDLVGIPWRVAFALQADGWFLRSDIIWSKPNPMPESVTDRPTKAHEYIFLMSKSAKYYYSAEAIKEDAGVFHAGGKNNAIDFPKTPDPKKKQDALGKPTYTGFNARYKARKPAGWNTAKGAHGSFHPDGRAQEVEYGEIGERRNKRTVWSIATQPYSGAHFATFPEEIPRLCILAGSRPGDVILDPFGGSGTTAKVALELGRKPVHMDLAYHDLARKRMSVTPAIEGLMT
jgi:DNA modification methylase